MEALLARHKKEQRDLVSQITGLKKQATKKNRKSVNAQCVQLQTDLDEKHKKEIDELNGVEPEQEILPEELLASMKIEEKEEAPEEVAQLAPKKRNRAKERLQKRQEQEEAIRAKAREEAEGETDYRAIEQELMRKVLASNGLVPHEIKPDGHCLFASIQDQLKQRLGKDVAVEELRREAAEFVRSHRDDFVPFLFDESTMSLRDVDEYTEELENTAMWGLDMEIMALARRYGVRFRVFSAGLAPIDFAPQETPEKTDSEGGEPETSSGNVATLYLAFYKHSYGLGEHYDSARDVVG